MLQPDSYDSSSPWGEKSPAKADEKSGTGNSSGRLGDVVSAGDPRDVAEVARALAAHGGGEASFELALDLVLHEVVEQARLATGATGAAIALARAGEMVCRATSGPDAPDLGVRLETTSGLSGACLQSGAVQLCGDTETDTRVDAEACRRLGVRSILVLPLGDGQQPFGILEVFSSLLDAFGDQDVSSLKNLALRVVVPNTPNNSAPSVPSTTGTEPFAPVQARVDEEPYAPEISQSIELNPQPEQEPLSEVAAPPAADGELRRGTDLWTAILGVLVIVTAIVLGLALGWRGAIVRGLNAGSNGGSPGAGSAAPASASPTEKTDQGIDSGADEEAPAGSSGDVAMPTKGSSLSQQGSSKAVTSLEPPSGGLVVTQDGKVIYRLSPGEPVAAVGNKATGNGAGRAESGGAAGTRLIHRVEPEYPDEARTQHIQGLVTLDVQIGGEGAVHNIAVVDGNAMLAEAAVQAVRQWRYQPNSVDGRPVEMQTRVTIRFTLPPN